MGLETVNSVSNMMNSVLSTPQSQRKRDAPRSPEGCDSFEAFSEEVRRRVRGENPCEAVADFVASVGLDAVARRLPSPHALACEWLPCVAELDVDAKSLRKALRARCIRAEPLCMPETRPEATRRRRLRDVELQVLLRAAIARLGRTDRASRADEVAMVLLIESASFDLQAPHVDCEAARRKRQGSPISPRVPGHYESLRAFFRKAIEPGLKRLLPDTAAAVARELELDEATPPTTLRRNPAATVVEAATKRPRLALGPRNGGTAQPQPQRLRVKVDHVNKTLPKPAPAKLLYDSPPKQPKPRFQGCLSPSPPRDLRAPEKKRKRHTARGAAPPASPTPAPSMTAVVAETPRESRIDVSPTLVSPIDFVPSQLRRRRR